VPFQPLRHTNSAAIKNPTKRNLCSTVFSEEEIQQPAQVGAGPETPGSVRVAPQMGKR
jgi:hypothetical protein